MRGIDISNWQAGISPSAIGIDFCIMKATEGTNFTDSYCDSWVQECIANGIPWGFYHFARPFDNSPDAEAEYFYHECENYFGHGIPVLDYEIWGANDVWWCECFIERLHDLSGIWPMIYISASHCGTFEGSWIPEKCGLWVAGYPQNFTSWINEDTPLNYNIYPWQFAAIWQFTSSLLLPNFAGNLDGDIAYMDKNGWSKYTTSGKMQAVSNAASQPGSVSANKSCDDLATEVIQGKWGNGWNRKQALDSAYGVGTYDHVQTIVDNRLGLDGC